MKKKIVSVLMAFTMLISCIGIQPLQAEADAGNKAETAVKEERTDVLGDAEKLVNNVSVEGTNSFGTMLVAEFAEKTEEIENGNGFFISAIEMEGTKATVSLEAIEDCTLVVAVYDEAGEEMLAVGSSEVTAGEQKAVVAIETENMPEYFDLMGYLIDTDSLRPLCSVFESPNYTREVQEFLKKTTEDFDENKVINLDNDITTNFLVCEEGTRKLSGNGGANRIVSVNEETNTYVIENADSSITALKQGDSFVYPYAEGEILAGKIAKITVSGTTATIVCEETSLEEVFECVRIEGESLSQEAEINEESIGEGFTYQGVSKEQAQGQYYGPNVQGVQGQANGVEFEETVHGKPLNFEMDIKAKGKKGEIRITGSLSLGIDASIKFVKTWSYKFLELKLDYKGVSEITIEGKLDKQSFKIGELKISPVPCVNIVLAPEILFAADAKISCTAVVEGTVGFQVTDEGMKNITTPPKAKVKVEIEATIYIGFALTPAIEIVDDWLARVEVTATVGAEITGKMAAEISTEQKQTEKKHICSACIDGDITAQMDLDFKASLFNSIKYEKKIVDLEKKIADFYFSFDYGEFALTSCPHYLYRVNILVKDEKGRAVSGAVVKDSSVGSTASYTTDALGMVTFWKPSGGFRVTAEKEEYQKAEKGYEIEDEAKWVTVVLQEKVTAAPDRVRSVALGGSHSAAIMENGDLYCWGNNGFGQVGNGTTKDQTTPVKVLENVESVSLGEYYSMVITRSGDLYCWGKKVRKIQTTVDENNEVQTVPMRILDNVESVYMDEFGYNSAAILKNGDLYCWGWNKYGQTGNGTTEYQMDPVKILENVEMVSLSSVRSAAIMRNGDLYCWGNNVCGAVGNGATEKQIIPVKVLENVESVSLSESHSAAITRDGDLYCWGCNDWGQVGNGKWKAQMVPVKVLSNIKSISLSESNSAAMTKEGELYCWGGNMYGQIGNGAMIDLWRPEKIMSEVEEVFLSWGHGAAIMENNDLYCWGNNLSGEIGNGTTKTQTVPTKVLSNIKSLSLDSYNSAAITNNGELYCWGSNYYGQIGNGTKTNCLIPTRITFPTETSYNAFATSSAEFQRFYLSHLESKVGNCTTKQKSFSGLKPGAVYNFYMMKDKESEQAFSSENLFYLKQAKADSEGVLQIEYPSNVPVSDAEAFVVCAEQDNIADAQITAKTAYYNGKEQFADITVIYNGKTLEAGRDYEIEGSFSATEAGNYSVTVTGIGDYTGEKTVDWEIKQTEQNKLGDVNGDDKIDAKDALAVLKYDVGIPQDMFIEKAADVDKDDKIDAKDALTILKHDVGILQIS